MQIKYNEKYEIYASVYQINDSTYDTRSVVVKLPNKDQVVLRVKKGLELIKEKVYKFVGVGDIFKEKLHIRVTSFTPIDELDISDGEKNAIYDSFYLIKEVDNNKLKKDIEDTIESIENKILKDITLDIYNRYKDSFTVYPAALRFHHSYKYGLLFHTHTILRLAKAYSEIYPGVNKDLLYSGVILHDIMKIKEIDSSYKEFSLEGKLIGHITMGAVEVRVTANKLGYEGSEEALLLEHILLSHHDQAEFGSPRHPQILEALIVHLCDASDAKIEPVVEALDKIKYNEYTEAINVCGKQKYYKHKIEK